jgi:hypothetical protein
MENPARFDLNEAIRQWRTSLQGSPPLSAQELHELESHLRDSTTALQAQGHPPEEAFRLASQRLGQPRELENEFGKLNPQRVWMDRALWMIAGLLLFSLVGWLAAIAREMIFQQMLVRSTNAHLIVVVSLAIQWLVMLGSIAVFWRLATRGYGIVTQAGRLCLRRPLLPILGLVALNYGKIPLFQWLLGAMSPVRPEMMEKIQQMRMSMTAWWHADWWFHCLFWSSALLYLARRQLRHQDLTWSSSAARVREVWFERGTWMVAGLFLNVYFLGDISLALETSMLLLAQSLPGNGHLLGFLSVCLQWAFVVGVVFLLWRWFARDEAVGRRIVRFGLDRPALGALLLLLSTFIPLIVQGLFLAAIPTASTSGLSGKNFHVILGWNNHARQLLYCVVPVLLFFWLARKRWNYQAA